MVESQGSPKFDDDHPLNLQSSGSGVHQQHLLNPSQTEFNSVANSWFSLFFYSSQCIVTFKICGFAVISIQS